MHTALQFTYIAIARLCQQHKKGKDHKLDIKIIHGIKNYGFMVSGKTIKSKSINWHS